ncbi:thiamine-triphosphatase isoform X3 [Echeneis naucrates]|uniref:thiamine-triphosphatase isoform X3 n=2 Tax=Echeneis naucrates TaxID=173247 RepID=UPI0011133641|nr:thiamine-triphosphatase isoform X3 [Echeneis naucrates]
MMTVEVERKFMCSANTLKMLEESGVLVGKQQFRDQYFDTPQFDLTLRDMWLRKREECWELKYPLVPVSGRKEKSGEQSETAAVSTCYKEITSQPEIQLKVKDVIRDTETGVTCLDDSWLSRVNLVCFAEFTTVRQSFTLEEEEVKIDLDQADFGYNVGELEMLITEGEDVHAALERIDRTARKLGLTADQRVEGKMNVYLKRNLPEHYAKLLSVHILRA